MQPSFRKSAGFSLILGSVLLIVTMVLHPSGGDVDHILAITPIIIGSHALAIFSMPWVGFGFWGLATLLDSNGRLSMLAFMMLALGLIAGMLAAAVNGLTLPFFVNAYSQDIQENPAVFLPILKYGAALNQAMDYILIAGIMLAMTIWSVLILRDAKMTKWLGYYGLVLALLAVVGGITRFNFIDLIGFRVFIFGIASWIIGVGVSLRRVHSPYRQAD